MYRVYTLWVQPPTPARARREEPPQLIDACDEFAWDEDPIGYLKGKINELQEGQDYETWRIVHFDVDNEVVDYALSTTVDCEETTYGYDGED